MRKKIFNKTKRVKGELIDEVSDQGLNYDSVKFYSRSERYFDGNSLHEFEIVSVTKSSKGLQFEESSEVDNLPEVQKSSSSIISPSWPQLNVGSKIINVKEKKSIDVKKTVSKKERDLVDAGSKKSVNLHSTSRLKLYIKLSLKLRDKYLRLAKHDKAIKNIIETKQHLEKARIFERVLARYQKRYEERTGNLHRI